MTKKQTQTTANNKHRKLSTEKTAEEQNKAIAGVKKPHRYHPGTKTLRDIKKYQQSTDTYLAYAGFGRTLRRLAVEEGFPELRFQKKVIRFFAKVAQRKLYQVFDACDELLEYKGVKTVTDETVACVYRIVEKMK
jgi:histone H3